eukprot:scaffold210829_cov31-Tisochrysis_lutea.AAC.2
MHPGPSASAPSKYAVPPAPKEFESRVFGRPTNEGDEDNKRGLTFRPYWRTWAAHKCERKHTSKTYIRQRHTARSRPREARAALHSSFRDLSSRRRRAGGQESRVRNPILNTRKVDLSATHHPEVSIRSAIDALQGCLCMPSVCNE